jgi:hypothetical protein
METLRASGVIASWLGAQASYRGARFSANFDRLPATTRNYRCNQ